MFDLARGLQTVEPGHPDIHEHDIGMKFMGKVYGPVPIFGFTDDDDVGVIGQKCTNAVPQDGMIISQQYSYSVHYRVLFPLRPVECEPRAECHAPAQNRPSLRRRPAQPVP